MPHLYLMLNQTIRYSYVLIFACLALGSCRKEFKSDVITRHEKQYPEIRKKYVYQSVIRLANIKRDPNFEKLIRDVQKIILYLPPSGDTTYQISALRPGIRAEGYEELIDVRTADAQRISLWVKESGKRSHYLGLVDSEEGDVILEIDGEIHPEYLSAVTLADQGALQNILKGGF